MLLFFQSLVLLLKIAINRHSSLKSFPAKYSAQIDRALSLNSCFKGERLYWEYNCFWAKNSGIWRIVEICT